MSRLGLTGTYLQRLLEVLNFAHEHRKKAFDYADKVKPDVVAALERRGRDSGRGRAHVPPKDDEIAFALDRRLTGDPKFTGPVSNERWGMRLASTYALVESLYTQRALVDRVETTNALLAELREEVRRGNDLLQQLLNRQT